MYEGVFLFGNSLVDSHYVEAKQQKAASGVAVYGVDDAVEKDFPLVVAILFEVIFEFAEGIAKVEQLTDELIFQIAKLAVGDDGFTDEGEEETRAVAVASDVVKAVKDVGEDEFCPSEQFVVVEVYDFLQNLIVAFTHNILLCIAAYVLSLVYHLFYALSIGKKRKKEAKVSGFVFSFR